MTDESAQLETGQKEPETGKPAPQKDELKLSELLILSSMWMLFGFMLWFYLSAFHGVPARLASEAILGHILGDDHEDSGIMDDLLPLSTRRLPLVDGA